MQSRATEINCYDEFEAFTAIATLIFNTFRSKKQTDVTIYEDKLQ